MPALAPGGGLPPEPPELFVYVLRLSCDRYYVGTTRDVARRFDEHCGTKGAVKGAAFTRAYPPLEIIESRACHAYEEDKVTKQMMAIYGVTCVRGGSYCQCQLPDGTVAVLTRELRNVALFRGVPLSIYVIELTGGKFFVGAAPADGRGPSVLKGAAAAWISAHLPVVKHVSTAAAFDLFEAEAVARQYMAHFGIENVRSLSHCALVLDADTLRVLKAEVATAAGTCFLCGETRHCRDACPQLRAADAGATTPPRGLAANGALCVLCGSPAHAAGDCDASSADDT